MPFRRQENFHLARRRSHYELIDEYDVIPFVTMKFLSQKQEECMDNIGDFQKKYGFIFRDYELITNINKKYEEDEKAAMSDFKSALTALRNSSNDYIKNIFTQISEEEITDKFFKSIISLITEDESAAEIFQLIVYTKSRIGIVNINTIEFEILLASLAESKDEVVNVYNPHAENAGSITNLKSFEHATLYVSDDEQYYHAIQNLLINEISLDKITLEVRNAVLDDGNEKYDTIISISPFINPKQAIRDGYRDIRNPNLAYLENLIEHMDDNSVIFTVIPYESLVKRNYIKFRRALVEDNKLDAVIECYINPREHVTILVIDNNKKTDDFLFIRLQNQYPRFTDEYNDEITDIYKERKKIDKKSNIVSKDKIIDNDYNLNPKRYIYMLDYEEVPVEDIIEKQKRYTSQLKNLNEDIEDLFNKIK